MHQDGSMHAALVSPRRFHGPPTQSPHEAYTNPGSPTRSTLDPSGGWRTGKGYLVLLLQRGNPVDQLGIPRSGLSVVTGQAGRGRNRLNLARVAREGCLTLSGGRYVPPRVAAWGRSSNRSCHFSSAPSVFVLCCLPQDPCGNSVATRAGAGRDGIGPQGRDNGRVRGGVDSVDGNLVSSQHVGEGTANETV